MSPNAFFHCSHGFMWALLFVHLQISCKIYRFSMVIEFALVDRFKNVGQYLWISHVDYKSHRWTILLNCVQQEIGWYIWPKKKPLKIQNTWAKCIFFSLKLFSVNLKLVNHRFFSHYHTNYPKFRNKFK